MVPRTEVRESMIRIDLVCPWSGERLDLRVLLCGVTRTCRLHRRNQVNCKKQRADLEKVENFSGERLSRTIVMHRSPLVFTDSTNPSAKRATCSTSESVTFNRFAPENAAENQIALHHDLQPLTPAQSKRYHEVENE